MEYTVQRLARLAGVSARTLRFYDEIGLLRPGRVSSGGYRIYGEAEVDRLQQILLLRALGLELSAIAGMLDDPAFDRLAALGDHLAALEQKRAQLDLLIDTVHKTIQKEKGEITMTDQEKFAGLKERLVADNEAQYGEEIRAKYGDAAIDASNAKVMGMNKETYDAMQEAARAILDKLSAAVRDGLPPEGDAGREVALLHRAWLGYTWPQYSREAHLGLVQMYLDDPRFTAYYDDVQPGNAQYLRDAVVAWSAAL